MSRPPAWTVRVARTGAVLALDAVKAKTASARMTGLLRHASLPDGEGMIFEGCRSIHTFGMRFPIDVVFVDRAWTVVRIMAALPPGRLPMPVWRAWGVVELPAGRAAKSGLQNGDQLIVAQALSKGENP